MTFRLHWTDYTHHRFGDKKPEPQFKNFDTREAADAEATQLKALHGDGMVTCVNEVHTKRKHKKTPLSDPKWKTDRGGMRLTR